ncbi:glucose-6-phosphate isomerase [Desulfonatronovibrio magnus]|uniref:glucose-6-phosphate isomerase n=1 Tax=Desulfonatronovibrio magnus TaxID=698827 RepID=UPI0005EB980D|nr:glucose-6-phosphate isomerase [Desulfonatronovibrio magnus]
MTTPNECPSWKKLQNHYHEIKNLHMRDMFASDPDRFDKFFLSSQDIFLDYSKNRITPRTMELLMELVRETRLQEKIQAMFTGEKINSTENRSVLHVALRNPADKPVYVQGQDVMPEVHRVLDKMRGFVHQVRHGEWTGWTGKKVRHVVNIGIGGSDLGPKMVTKALSSFNNDGPEMHFVSNVDPAHLENTLKKIDAETTLFIIASKSFTTQETMFNARQARSWFLEHAKNENHIERHFVAVSTNTDRVRQFGINPDNMFEFWDWVGGRFSLWSAIGLPIALSTGMNSFEQLLQGAHDMDNHFRSAPIESNMPIILALLSIWYTNFFQAQTQAVLPYSQYLKDFPAYLQQGEMESNGKSSTLDGNFVNYATGPVIWGEPGTNGQHAFYQLLHQGTVMVPCDFIIFARQPEHNDRQHRLLMANYLAQTQALMTGKTEEEARQEMNAAGMPPDKINKLLAHKIFPGNRPSNSIMIPELTPRNLGKLIALYEHKIFVQGAVWNINSFDQWGVELGKQLARAIEPELDHDRPVTSHDSSTNGLINLWKKL